MFTNPTVAEFKLFFVRDFPYGSDIETTVVDGDITRAILEADNTINQSLFGTQEQYTQGFMYLTAHQLVVNLRNSSQGLSGKYSWLQTSRSVGSVSESVQIPDRILANPILAMLSQTTYGAKYLEMVLGQLNGQIFVVHGNTNP